MKRKVLLLFLVLFLISILAGCGLNFLDFCDESSRAEQTVWDYWQAIINRQYELAKYYCIVDGIWYNKTDEWEEYINTISQGETSILILNPHFQGETEVIGNNATVYMYVSIAKITFFNNHFIYEGETFEYEIELIKQDHPPGDWELK